jgi:catechol 2,3-dioxygenase-like lactoylglutathione lyase family enzyme
VAGEKVKFQGVNMIGHMGIYVDDLQESDTFYRPLLKAIGYDIIFSKLNCIAYGVNGTPFFEIYIGKPKSTGLHIAFHVDDKQMVEMFHAVGLRIGGVDNGKPGYREYTPGYYAAFIIDPNGHNLEAYLEQ